MGNARWSSQDWDLYAAANKGKSARQIFNAAGMKADMDPAAIKVRESRDSASNPQSTPIILALDVTGSMGMIAESLAREGLGALVEEILARKPVTDPHIMVMGVGDAAAHDRAPLQVSQFEADIRIADQLKNLFLEGGGGGNRSESYTLPWYFAAAKTDIDCVKQGRKGILFTFGDEECPAVLTKDEIKRVLGDDVPADLTTADLMKMVSQKFDVYHVVIEQGSYARRAQQEVYDSWGKVLPPERIVSVKDYTKLPQVLVSVMEVHGGKDPADVVASWQGATAEVVKDAIKNAKPVSASAAAAVSRAKKKVPAAHFILKPAA